MHTLTQVQAVALAAATESKGVTMATSITQAKPLLTAAELELFDQSRAEPVKSFTAKQLASKEKRVRALRDKYRDLYRRQTVAQRGKAEKAGGSARGKAMPSADAADKANARTQQKGEIMQEVLERYEARSALLAAREERESAAKPGKAAANKAVKPATTKKIKEAGRNAPAKTGGTLQKPVAQTTANAKAKKSAVASDKPKTSASASKKAKVPEKTGKASAPRSASARSTEPLTGAKRGATSNPKRTEAPLSAVGHLGRNANGVAGAEHVDHLTGQDPTERSHKAPSDMAPAHGGKAHAPDVNAPLDMVPAARRGNPVRNMPGNIAIQGHVSSSVRRAQGKKDSR